MIILQEIFMEVFGAFYLKCHNYSKICQLWTLAIFEIILPIQWQRVSFALVCMTPSLRSRIWKSSCTIAVTASFKFSRSSSGFIWVSTICVSVAVNPYKCSYSVISRVKLIIVFTQKDTVLHGDGVAVPPNWTYNAAIMSSRKQYIANTSHFSLNVNHVWQNCENCDHLCLNWLPTKWSLCSLQWGCVVFPSTVGQLHVAETLGHIPKSDQWWSDATLSGHMAVSYGKWGFPSLH